MKKPLFVLFFAAMIFWSGNSLAAGQSNRTPVVKVMTQNIYLGADLDIILDEFDPDNPQGSLLRGVTLFLQSVEATDFEERAEVIAQQIKRERPDVIGLQEVALFEFLSDGMPIDVIDYRKILLDALAAHNLDYEVAAISVNTEIVLPAAIIVGNNPVPVVLRAADRDAVLKRRRVDLSAVEIVEFDTLRMLPIPSLPAPFFIPEEVKRGYIALDATIRGETYRIVNTHLENEGEDPSVQDAQAAELIETLSDEQSPVILMGDFNSGPSAEQPIPREGSPYDQLLMEGYLDAWEERQGPRRHSGDPGFTCCQDKGLLNAVSELDKRIDLIWVGHVMHEVLSRTVVVGDDQRDRTPSDLWPADHAGVASKLHIW